MTDFANRTAALVDAQRKAILDGMLYEVFFDSEGQHRNRPKFARFNDLFKLQVTSDFANSFTFMQGCLAPFADRYFEIPGNGREVTLGVRTNENESGDRTISAIWWDSVNILRTRAADEDWFAPRDRAYKYGELTEFLSEETVLPLQQLRVELDFPYTNATKITWLADSEIEKPSSQAPLE